MDYKEERAVLSYFDVKKTKKKQKKIRELLTLGIIFLQFRQSYELNMLPAVDGE